MPKTVFIEGGEGEMSVQLQDEAGRQVAMIWIDGVLYHFERVPKSQLLSEYRVDTDPDYNPAADDEGYCYILAPFSQ